MVTLSTCSECLFFLFLAARSGNMHVQTPSINSLHLPDVHVMFARGNPQEIAP